MLVEMQYPAGLCPGDGMQSRDDFHGGRSNSSVLRSKCHSRGILIMYCISARSIHANHKERGSKVLTMAPVVAEAPESAAGIAAEWAKRRLAAAMSEDLEFFLSCGSQLMTVIMLTRK
jgi:hypothetical protein